MPNETTLREKLEHDVRLKVFVIGVGNAGNQTIVLGQREGLDVFAINTSAKDLSDQIVGEQIQSFIIGKEARGSGKNIKKGISLYKENGRELFTNKYFMDKCQEADVIVVTSATGGGTGPSASPEICKTLWRIFNAKEFKKIIMYHGITPKNGDSNIAFANTTYCMNEIKTLGIPYYLTDLEWYANLANDKAFIEADKHVISCIKAIAGMNLQISSSQMVDENDMKSVISEPGYQCVYTLNGITSAMLESNTMQGLLIKNSIKPGPAMMIQRDGISMQMCAMINCPEDMQDPARTGNYDELYSYIGHRPKNGVYENYSVTNGTDGQMVIILSGLTYPINRMQYYIDAVNEQDDFLKKQKQIDTAADAGKVMQMISNDADKLTSDTVASEEDIASALDDIFN